MGKYEGYRDLGVALREHVATVEIRRAPFNFFDFDLIRALADLYEALDADDHCRAIVLCSAGKAFCAGANFAARESWGGDALREQAGQLYVEAVRLFRTAKPVVAAVQGAAVGGGLGLAMSADFRVTCPQGRFSANFARLGFHQGFGLSVTLPRVVGTARAELMLYTGRRIKGEEALAWGMAEQLVEPGELRAAAFALAREIAVSAPLAVRAIRRTQRGALADVVAAATEHELAVQTELRDTEDFREGVRAMDERREPRFLGR